MSRSRVTLKSDLGRIAAEAHPKAAVVVEKVSHDIAAGAQTRTPPKVDTGALMGSWQATPAGELEWIAFNPMDYAIYVEHGSHHPPRAYRTADGGMDVTREYTIPAHPMIVPAAEENRELFMLAMKQVFQ